MYEEKQSRLDHENKLKKKSSTSSLNEFALGGFIFILLVGSAVLAYFNFDRFLDNKSPSTAQVYLQIKVLDDGGHPVAGASVFYQETMIGVTDSFGEWQRFIKASLGSTIKIFLRKTIEGKPYTVTKNIAVPLVTEHNEVDIRRNIQLSLTDKKTTNSIINISQNNKLETASNIQLRWLPSFEYTKDHNNYKDLWIQKKLLPEINRLLNESIQMREKKQQITIILQHLSYTDDPSFRGLLRVIRPMTEDLKERDFLINYSKTTKILAAQIIQHLLDPVTGTKFEIKVPKLYQHQVNIYVSGRKAAYQGQEKWSYQTIHKSGFVSITNKDKIIYRKFIQHRDTGQVLSLPKTLALK